MPHPSISTRLRECMQARALNASELSRLSDVKTSFIYDILSGKSLNPSTITLARVAETLGVSLHYLAGSEETPSGAPDNQYVALPRLNVEVSAGGGAHVVTETAEEYYYFRKSWIRDRLMTTVGNLRLLFVRGDSMEPTLHDGDIILADMARVEPHPPGIFVLFDGLGLVVKRLEYIATEPGSVRILSDNPQYGAYERPLSEARIIGRVVWFAREL